MAQQRKREDWRKFCVLWLFIIACFLFVLVMPRSIFAQNGGEIIVSPTIIDKKAAARDILEFSAKLKNLKDSKVDLYPIINDISIQEGRQEFLDPTQLDKSTSLARWLKISRGRIEIFPGEEKDISFSAEVNVNARPGKYYAIITFAEGAVRVEAEESALKLNYPHILMNIVENAQLKNFQTDKNFFFEPPVNFSLEIENIGNREIKPKGYIYIYNNNKQEIAAIDINQAGRYVSTADISSFESIWQGEKKFGQYKARLSLEYGKKERRDLQDTIYFWILPWRFLFFSGGIFFLLIVSLFLIFRKSKRRSKPVEVRYPDKVIDLRPPKR